LKRLLRRYDIDADRDKGQHFLVNRDYLDTVAKGAGTGKVALEIGAGPGSLTCLLKERFRRIVAIEVDDRFSDLFNNLNSESHVELVLADFLSLDLDELGLGRTGKASLVGNIPYNITGKVLERAITDREHFSKAVFTTQKEVADRVLAEPGTKDCGAITYYVRAYADVERLGDVPPDAFYPPPRVESSIIEMVFAPEKQFESPDEEYFSVVRGLFNYRRKTIRKGLIVSPNFTLDRDAVDELLDSADLDPGKRPEELSLEEFDRITHCLIDGN
jgi:16S rRNA (adenine1518-N6/adenine1519-N6)-dimethyltransferase